MLFFGKTEYRETELPFILYDAPEDAELGGITIEAYGNVFGEEKFCHAVYILKNRKMYDNGDYEQLRDLLADSAGRRVTVTFKYKKGKLRDFKINTDSLAECYGDERFKMLDLIGWGMNDKSIREIDMEYFRSGEDS